MQEKIIIGVVIIALFLGGMIIYEPFEEDSTEEYDTVEGKLDAYWSMENVSWVLLSDDAKYLLWNMETNDEYRQIPDSIKDDDMVRIKGQIGYNRYDTEIIYDIQEVKEIGA